MAHYVPRIDGEYTEWAANFTEYAAANAASLGLSAGEVTDLQALLNQWKADFNAAFEGRAHYLGLMATKKESRKVSEQYIRQLAQRIQHHPDITNSVRAGLGITIRDKTRTLTRRPEDAPSMLIDFSKSHWHLIHWGHSPMNERINGKPKGVYACEIRYHVGFPPANMDPEDYLFTTVATKSPAKIVYSEHFGERIYYICRYLNTRMEPGPWGARASALLSI